MSCSQGAWATCGKKWMEECSFKFADFSVRVTNYCQSNAINVQEKDEEHSAASGEIIDEDRKMVHKTKFRKVQTFNGDMRK